MPALMVDEICQFLVQFSPAITVGTPATALTWNTNPTFDTLYGYELPDKPDAAVGIWPYGGGLPHLVDNVDEPLFQVRVRDPQPISGEATIQQIFNAFHGILERTLIAGGDWYWNRMFALQNPVYLGRDDVQRFQWSLNVRGFVKNPNRGASGNVDH